jgi:hypothetical protein
MVVSSSAFPTFGENDFLALIQNLHNYFFRFRIPDHSSQRNVDINVISVGAMFVLSAPCIPMASYYVSRIFQMQKRPVLCIPSNDDVSTTTTIAAIRASLGRHPISHKMSRTRSTSARTAADLYVIDKIFT